MAEIASVALAQIVASSEKNIWDAHRGCAMLAAALLIKEKLIDEEAGGCVQNYLAAHRKAADPAVLGGPNRELSEDGTEELVLR